MSNSKLGRGYRDTTRTGSLTPTITSQTSPHFAEALGMNSGWLETGKDHRMAAGSPGSSAPSAPTICHSSATVLFVPTAVGCCPSAARRTEPGVRTTTRRPLEPRPWKRRRHRRQCRPSGSRGHWEYPWLGRLWRPAVQRLRNTLVLVKDLRPSLNRMFGISGRNGLWAIFLLRTSNLQSTQNYHQPVQLASIFHVQDRGAC
jgi:hypothetical protein